MKRRTVILVGVSPKVHGALRSAFEAEGAAVVDVAAPREALERARTSPISILVAPARLLAGGGADLLDRARRLRPSLVGVGVLDGVEPEAATAILREGVFALVDSDLSAIEAEATAIRASAQADLLETMERSRETLGAKTGYRGLVGGTSALRRARERIARLAEEDGPALFVGEEGTGRELAARVLHAASRRARFAFVTVEPRGTPDAEIAAEITGYSRRPGALERAAGGSVFVREIERLPAAVQDTLAMALRTGVYRQGRDGEERPLEARLLASSARDASVAAAEGRIPRSLAERFAGATVRLPPLRDRRADVALLSAEFLETIRKVNGLPALRLSPEALRLLERHPWPGNVRELRQTIEQAALLAEDGILRPRDLPEAVRLGESRRDDPSREGSPVAFREAKRRVVDRFERAYLRDLLDAHAGNVTEAAAHAGMMRSALQRLLRKHGVRSSEFRRGRAVRAPEDRA